MKELVKYVMLILCAFFLFGCTNKDAESVPEQTVPADNAADNLKNQTEGEADTGLDTVEPETYEPVTGDNLTVGKEFAGDLAEEKFDKLIQAYSYDGNMKEAIASDETKKTILFYNAEYGEIRKMDEPYVLSVGAYQYVMVPVESSAGNFNYEIAFDGNHNITGFNYGKYDPKESKDEDSIPDGVTENEITFTSGGFVIPGTFTAPEEGDHFPVVVLVQGSGPSDRDESIYENKPFRDIAWALAGEGIASYRFDKRSYLYEEQMKEDVAATIKDEITDDVVAAAGMVKKLEQVDPYGIYILGHSLGGYAMPIIAQELPEAAGYILMAAPAEHLKEYIYDQYEFLAEEDERITEEEQKKLDSLLKQIKLLNNPADIPDNKAILGAYKAYWTDLLTYNPIKEAGKIEKPVLVLQGERDYQVPIKQFNLWKENFGDSDNWIFKSYASLNHFMMPGYGRPSSAEYRKRSHVDESVTRDIIQFIKDSIHITK